LIGSCGWRRGRNEVARRLQTIQGVGPVIASALTATVIDARLFRNGRELAAWSGLTPRQHSTGGRLRLGGISKRGDRYLKLTRLRGALQAFGGGALHAQDTPALLAGIPAANG